ncbi:MAG: hypothetical protein EAZ99_04225 [Alphaproteobacteria bacterium]|nr:MAG: hypothetical protein EAZ99_04225 [Alphaproteobacteria bacterium]
MVSMPPLPTKESAPAFPTKLSASRPPRRVSSPAPPAIVCDDVDTLLAILKLCVHAETSITRPAFAFSI